MLSYMQRPLFIKQFIQTHDMSNFLLLREKSIFYDAFVANIVYKYVLYNVYRAGECLLCDDICGGDARPLRGDLDLRPTGDLERREWCRATGACFPWYVSGLRPRRRLLYGDSDPERELELDLDIAKGQNIDQSTKLYILYSLSCDYMRHRKLRICLKANWIQALK